MTTTTTMTKNMPLAITQEHVDIMLQSDTRWINEHWDGEYETMRDAINEGNYRHYPCILYGGTRGQRHALHRKLGHKFSHESINMDDGTRVMVIINRPGYMYTINDHSVCFFTRQIEYADDRIHDERVQLDWELRDALNKMRPRTQRAAAGPPHRPYSVRHSIASLDEWRVNVNKMIETKYMSVSPKPSVVQHRQPQRTFRHPAGQQAEHQWNAQRTQPRTRAAVAAAAADAAAAAAAAGWRRHAEIEAARGLISMSQTLTHEETQDLAGLIQQLEDITTEIKTLIRPASPTSVTV